MMITNRVMHGHRAAVVAALGALAYLGIGAWAVVKFAEADWVMGAVATTCVLLGVPKLISTVQRMRRQERRQ